MTKPHDQLSAAARELQRIYDQVAHDPSGRSLANLCSAIKDCAIHGLNHLERARQALDEPPLRLEDRQTWDLRRGFVKL